jgi:hypothetical protein
MNSRATVSEDATTASIGERRRSRKTSEGRDKAPVVFFCLAEAGPDTEPLVLNERFDLEGEAMVASLKRNEPYYRVEAWKAHAVVNDGAVAVEKEPVKRP